MPLKIRVGSDRVEPPPKAVVLRHGVDGCCRLQELELGQDFKLLAPLLKVDEAIFNGVWQGSVYHGEVSQECTQVWYSTLYNTLWSMKGLKLNVKA